MKLLPDVGVDGADLHLLQRELAARLRDGRVDLARAHEHVRETLRAQLSVNNPFFDTRTEIEQ